MNSIQSNRKQMSKEMKIHYLSDLHLEYEANRDFLRHQPLKAMGDILILAGDCFYLGDRLAEEPFLKWAADNYEHVLLIPGNHEFYDGFDLADYGPSWQLKIQPNMRCCYNKVVSFGDTDIILSTLWSEIPKENERAIGYFLTDFHRIKYDGHDLTVADYNHEHEVCLRFVRKSVAKSKAKHKIVVTHHVPTRYCTPPKLRKIRGGSLQDAFTVDLTSYIQTVHIDYWIYGHSHVNMDRQVGSTIITSNQLGYVSHEENTWNKFQIDKTIQYRSRT